MALSSSQIYVATYRATNDDKSRLAPTAPPRLRTQDPPVTSRWRFGRSTTNLREPDSRSSSSTKRAPSPSPSVPKSGLERSASKMSLFNLFSKPKVEKARGHTEVGLAVPMRPPSPQKQPPVTSTPKSSLRQNPPPAAQQSIRARSSQIFRPMSMRPSPVLPNDPGSWDPPPLFQAFPQSLKHATVQACVYAPEILMRTQSQRRQAEILLERMDSVRDLSVIAEDGTEAKKLERNHRRLISNSVLNPPPPELTNKIYILVTAGYVLQYAGDGSFDRTPEKVLKLGKDSAAFACDLIPGKHWVLQISSHAHDEGTTEPVRPRNSMLSRLRSQNAVTRQSATSFLLVLESAEEMDSWMMAVRKEIDNHGGRQVKDESRRASTSTEDSKQSSETTSHRFQVQRDPKAPSKIPIDSPLQSQYGSPKIVTSDWESNRSERTTSIAESLSGQSYRYGAHRQSTESSSVASTPVSQDQMQLDQLRGRPRYSFMSTATSASTPGTRNTSRSSSPVPQSPLADSYPPGVDGEPFRSATSLKSFHMNPGNSMSSRRRSMQPLPVTNEDLSPSTKGPQDRLRHSLYGPTSPKMADPDHPGLVMQAVSVDHVSKGSVHETQAAGFSRPATREPIKTAQEVANTIDLEIAPPAKPLGPSPARYSSRTYNLPPRRDVVSPPPREPAPLPPTSAPRQTVIRPSQEMAASNAALPYELALGTRAARRISATPRPFNRPLPVRPQQQHADPNNIIPRRLSSLTPNSKPAPLPLRVNVNRSVTAPVSVSTSMSMNKTAGAVPATRVFTPQPEQTPRRPMSIQPRANQQPFQNITRPVRAVASTPSFVPSKRSSNPPLTAQAQPISVSADAGVQNVPAHMSQRVVAPRRSMGAIGLPPPLPPPDVPLPPPPPTTQSSHSSMALPGPAPSIPLPAPPPNIPLPSLPPSSPLPPLPVDATKEISP